MRGGRRGIALACLASACGRIGFEARNGDAPVGTSDSSDSGVAACGTTALLADTFDAAATSPQWSPYMNGSITTMQSGGQLVITLPATTSGSFYGGYGSSWSYDLRGSRVFVEVVQTTSTATHAQTNLQVAGSSGDYLELAEEHGTLRAYSTVNSVQSTIGSIAYDPVMHRWWQMREAQGTVYFETSADGATFVAFASLPTPAYASLVEVAIEAGTYQAETAPGAARFDNLNNGTPSGNYCAASSLRDHFDTGAIGPAWGNAYVSGGCSYAEGAGGVTVSLVSTGTQDCALVSASGFDLRGDAVFTEVTVVPSSTGQTFSYLRVAAPNDDSISLETGGNNLYCAQDIGGTYSTLCTLVYDSNAHKFWRISESAGMTSWQTSPDGANWATLLTHASPISLDGVDLAVGAGTNNAVASPGAATFATFDQFP
jgi:hypothetical protein